MRKQHGFSIPDEPNLIVDVETLIQYLHLVIFGYYECLHCGSQRGTPEAAQQHMTGKGHCKVDMEKGSEFRDFYDFGAAGESRNAEDALPSDRCVDALIDQLDKAMRLPSGKILSHRTATKSRSYMEPSRRTQKQQRQVGQPSLGQPSSYRAHAGSVEAVPDGESDAAKSKRIAKRDAIFLNQLASLRATDRSGLAHLPVWKQRAVVLQSKKEREHAHRQENAMLLKIQLKANK